MLSVVCCCLHIKKHPGLVSIQYLLLSKYLCTHLDLLIADKIPWRLAYYLPLALFAFL